jgi:hypothetical protein
MKLLRTIIVVIATSMAAVTWAATPSDESLTRLLDVMQSKRQIDDMIGQVDEVMKKNAEKTLQGRTMSARDQEVFNGMMTQMTTLLKEEFSWLSLEPIFRKVYRESFSQEEVDGMIEFYQTPTGRAVVTKLPQVMQSTSMLMQQKLAGLKPRLEKIFQEAKAKTQEPAAK